MKTWLAAALLLASPAFAQDNPMQPSAIWDDLRDSVAGLTEEPPIDPAALDLDAPVRANDAALVPIRLTQAADAPPLSDLTLVIDQNPAPVAAEKRHELGRAGQAQRRWERERGCARNGRSLGPRGRVPSRRLPPSHALRPGLALLLERVLQLRVLPLHVGEHLLHVRRIAAGLLRVRLWRVLRLRRRRIL